MNKERIQLWKTKEGKDFTLGQKLFGEHYATVYYITGLLTGLLLAAIT